METTTDKEIAALKEKIEQLEWIHEFRIKELKGRSRVFLEYKLSPLLESAYECTEMEPPRKNIVIERLEMVKSNIEREVEWLRGEQA
jgi:hypothetical protein